MKPIIRWVGGKRKLVQTLIDLGGEEVIRGRRIVEPFAGGAALTMMTEPDRAWLNDACEPLIHFYESVNKNPSLVHKWYKSLVEYGIDQKDYYEIRDAFNKMITSGPSYKKAGHFLYLNRIGFQGIWRVNQEGRFNVPHGGYVNPRFISQLELAELSSFLKHVQLTSVDYTSVLRKCRKGDVVYADPPYLDHFDAYTGAKFGYEEHKNLAGALHALRKRGAVVMVSNSNNPHVQKLYPKKHWKGFVVENVQSLTPHNSDGSTELALLAR